MLPKDNDKKEVILVLPYLNVNTTSTERFKSLIQAFESDESCTLRVIVIDDGIKRSYFGGLDRLNIDSFPSENYTFYKTKYNFIQRFAFKCVNASYNRCWRVLQLIHLLVYRTDIFNPSELNLAQKSHSQGYVITSGSHFSFFSTAQKLAQQFNYKLILDYRDPWTFGYPSVGGLGFIHKLKKLAGRKQEELLLRQALLITTVSNSLKNFFPTVYHHKIHVFGNGNNFLVSEMSTSTPSSKFNIVYAGTIYDEQLIDDVFFEAMKLFILNKDISKIGLQFIGSVHNSVLKNKIEKYGLSAVTEITPRLKNTELIEYLNNASLFLHLRYGDKKSVISSKQAEYLAFRRPILLPVSDGGDIEESILQNDAGYVCNNLNDVIKTLEKLWAKFDKGENLFITQPEEFIESLNRKNIAESFVKLILRS